MKENNKPDKVEQAYQKGNTLREKAKTKIAQWFAIILFAVCALAALISQFCDISVQNKQDIEKTILQTAVVFVSTMCISFSFYASGKARGKKMESFISARVHYSELIKKVEDRNLAGGLDQFCQDYKEEELLYYRQELIKSVNLDYDKDFLANKDLGTFKILGLKKYAWRQRTAMVKALNAKPKKLTTSAILGNSKVGQRKQFVTISEEGKTAFDMAKKIITWLLVSALTTYYFFSAKLGADISAFANFMKLMVAYTMSAVTSHFSGIATIENQAIRNYNSRSDILTVYLERNAIEEPQEKEVKELPSTEVATKYY